VANEAVVITRMSGGNSGARVLIVHMQGAGSGTGQVRITGMRGITPGAFTIEAGSGQTADPFQVVQLNAVIIGVGTVDQWVWTQTAGPAVTLVGVGPSVQYRAPATQFGTSLTFTVTATTGSTTLPPDSVTHTIRSHSGMYRVTSSGVLYGIERRRKARIPLVALGLDVLGGAPLGSRNLGV
jgi:hypothetical protein